MKVISTIKEIRDQLKNLSLSPVGLVPTMGALHKGHLSLVSSATDECKVVVVSIFINPTQFNDKEDLRKYPRTLEADLALLKKTLRIDDIVFTPSDSEMYPVEDIRIFHFGNLDRVMEALHRPGHFNGVAQVVSKLFEIVNPQIAYFGLKDFQQFAVIKELIRQNNYKVRIQGIPIIREADGLAMSSRNSLLDPEIRKKVPVIFRTISEASHMIICKEIPGIKEFVKKTIQKDGSLQVEYFEVVDDRLLIPVNNRNEMKENDHYYGCIAVRAGNIRLIDNIEFSLR